MANKAGMSTNLGLPAIPEVESIELFSALMTVYNAIKNLGYSLDFYTGNTPISAGEYADINYISSLQLQKTAIVYVKLIADVSAGHTINLVDSGGLRARKAQSTAQPCHGYAVVGGVTGETIPVCLIGLCQSIGGLIPGTTYYQSASAGQVTPTNTGQKVGIALGPNHLWFNPH